MFWVYQIEIGGVIRYIGYTNDLIKREKQHNYLCFKTNKKKLLYNSVRKLGIKEIKLKPLKPFKDKVDAKRWECYLILNDWFNGRLLWQRVPKISDV